MEAKLQEIQAILTGAEVQTLVPLTAQVIKMLSGKDFSQEAAALLDMVIAICKDGQVILQKTVAA